MSWWGTREHVTGRMGLEIEQMKETFRLDKPTVFNRKRSRWDKSFVIQTRKLGLVTNDGEPYWVLSFRMVEDGGKMSKYYTLLIRYPKDYPDSAPEAYLPEERLSDETPHLYTAHHGELCLTGHTRRSSSDWDAARGRAATIALWAIHWIRAYNYWQKHYRWPSAS